MSLEPPQTEANETTPEQTAMSEGGTAKNSAGGDAIEYHWYILQSYAGFEKRVRHMLEERLRVENLEHLVDEIFIPIEQVTYQRKGVEKTREVTYYPGYILVHICLTPELWHVIMEIPRVSGFIGGTKQAPEPISDAELHAIKSQIESGAKQAELDHVYRIGRSVQIIDGPFSDFNGVIEEVDNTRSKVKVTVNIFGRSTPLELDFDKITVNEEE